MAFRISSSSGSEHNFCGRQRQREAATNRNSHPRPKNCRSLTSFPTTATPNPEVSFRRGARTWVIGSNGTENSLKNSNRAALEVYYRLSVRRCIVIPDP